MRNVKPHFFISSLEAQHNNLREVISVSGTRTVLRDSPGRLRSLLNEHLKLKKPTPWAGFLHTETSSSIEVKEPCLSLHSQAALLVVSL